MEASIKRKWHQEVLVESFNWLLLMGIMVMIPAGLIEESGDINER